MSAAPRHTAADNIDPTDAPPECAHGAFTPADSPESALAWSAQLARTHYENFPVISLLLPRSLRQDFCNIYAFCRIADDLGDEMHDPAASLRWLGKLREAVLSFYDEARMGERATGRRGQGINPKSETRNPKQIPKDRDKGQDGKGLGDEEDGGLNPKSETRNPNDEHHNPKLETRNSTLETPIHNSGNLVVALNQTIRRFDIPPEPFLDLISAFEQDQRVTRYDTFDQVLDYCRRSADPVGRLVLYVCGYRDEQRQRLSDFTCSALQLINFWQDVRRDILDRDRIYIPRDSMKYFGVTEDQLRRGECNQNYRDLIQFEVNRAEAMFDRGEQLLSELEARHRSQVALFGQGGRVILQSIRGQDYDTLSRRPVLTRRQKGRLILRGLAVSARRFI